MDYLHLIETMSPQTYQNLRRSVELGKWPNGKALTLAQRENALQAVIAWGERHLQERDRAGFIDRKHKAGDKGDTSLDSILSWKD